MNRGYFILDNLRGAESLIYSMEMRNVLDGGCNNHIDYKVCDGKVCIPFNNDREFWAIRNEINCSRLSYSISESELVKSFY